MTKDYLAHYKYQAWNCNVSSISEAMKFCLVLLVTIASAYAENSLEVVQDVCPIEGGDCVDKNQCCTDSSCTNKTTVKPPYRNVKCCDARDPEVMRQAERNVIYCSPCSKCSK